MRVVHCDPLTHSSSPPHRGASPSTEAGFCLRPGLCYNASTTRTVIFSIQHALPPLPTRDCTYTLLPVATVCPEHLTPSRSLSIPVPRALL